MSGPPLDACFGVLCADPRDENLGRRGVAAVAVSTWDCGPISALQGRRREKKPESSAVHEEWINSVARALCNDQSGGGGGLTCCAASMGKGGDRLIAHLLLQLTTGELSCLEAQRLGRGSQAHPVWPQPARLKRGRAAS